MTNTLAVNRAKTRTLCIETALEFWQTAEAPSLEDIRRLFGLLVDQNASGLVRMLQDSHTTQPFPEGAFHGWHPQGGCWVGPGRYESAALVHEWLASHNVGTVIERGAMGIEVRVRYLDRDHGYWWPNAASADAAAEELQRVL